MSALYELVANQQWQVATTHIQSLADGDAADQIFHQSQYGNTAIMMHGMTAIMWACYLSAPLELVQQMITKAKLDSRKRCLLAITGNIRWTALHWAAYSHSDPAVLSLLIQEHPQALCATDVSGRTPLQLARYSPAPIIAVLEVASAKLAVDDICVKFGVPPDVMLYEIFQYLF